MIKYHIHKFMAHFHMKFFDYHRKRLDKWYQYVHEVDMENAIRRYYKNDEEVTKEVFTSLYPNVTKTHAFPNTNK